MSIIDPILAEFSHEAASTRKYLEIVPEAKFDWKPHAKSMPLGKLASHIAEIPSWATTTVTTTELNLTPEFKPANCRTVKELLGLFDKNIADATKAMQGQKDEALFVPWTLKMSGNPILTMPRVAVLRSFVMSHLIHHRGQLSVYLRLNDVKLPGIYGPTADDSRMG